MSDLQEFQTQHLFLLVGTNPLPNYVAARLLLEPGGHVYLVHTDETAKIADRLIAALGLANVTKIPVKEDEGDKILAQVTEHAKGKPSVGLNYTGGTKMMAVHAYRAVEQACPEAVFSYLDAASLSMILERQGPPNLRTPVALEVKPDIQTQTLLALHGYTLKHEPIQEAARPEVCQALAKIGIQWREWCDQNLRSGPNTPFRKKAGLEAVMLPCVEGADWQDCHTLGELATRWGVEAGELAEWLDGKWLEHYTLWALRQIASECQIHQSGMHLEPKERDFEFDVAAMRGHQLFALSCSTESKKGVLKLKLFEAYVRARQMGGEEARVGLVCCAPTDNPDSNPAAIQSEIEETWDAKGKVRVFGAEHLPNLPDYLRDWFNSQP
jgi:hypothetical protein